MGTTVRLLSLASPRDLMQEFGRIGVDRGGRRIMLPKGAWRCFKVSRLPSFCANILKQEMLALGAEAAVSRGALTGGAQLTDCILLGNLAQFDGLLRKLKRQPLGLAGLGAELRRALAACARMDRALALAGRTFALGRRTWLMGVVNATPDSFSGDGLAGRPVAEIAARIESMVRDGADIIDIGGESSRPGARPVSARVERARVIPLLKAIRRRVRVPVSVDTVKSEVARAALDSGACVINDISALRHDKKMAGVVARGKAAVVLMHMQGTPRTMQKAAHYRDVLQEVTDFLRGAIRRALDAGIAEDRIIVDPGIGFGKTFEHNIEILRRLPEFGVFGRPVCVGLSRKSFIGRLTGKRPEERGWGTASAVAHAAARGADILRVHDIGAIRQVLKVSDALTK
ncbi:MAG: dihydropteroate synthase [Deltaproteobacteria bacterium]